MDPLIKIPLSERLQSAGTVAPNFLSAFELFISDYYTTMGEMTQDPRFSATYQTAIAPYSRRNKGGELTELLLSEVVDVVSELPPPERAEVLYKLLIEPFARLHDCEKESEG